MIYLSRYKSIVVLGGDVSAKFDVTKTLPSVKMLKNVLEQFVFQYTNDQPTQGKACLENAFINLPSADYNCCVVHPDIADHEGVELLVRVKDESMLNDKPTSTVTFRNTSVARLDSFMVFLSDIDWYNLFFSVNMKHDNIFESFFSKFLELFNTCCPLKTLREGRESSTNAAKLSLLWYTPELEAMKNTVMAYNSTSFKGV